MARRKPNQPTGEIKLELGELYPKQWQFIESKTRYTAYGGARGGGKTHVLYDWIFMDEATHFTEYEFRTMGATLRGVNEIPKHFYLTCNPGGVGHQWVKRLFVTREYEGVESGRDYSFIPATVEDNKELLKASPEYIQMLDTLPEDIRAAHRYGDWDAMAGQYFSEFRRERHVVKPFIVPKEWPRYRAFDYGLDMFACYWFAIDFDDRVWVYREYCESGLIVSEAAAAMRRLTPPGEQIQFTVAPPDMWSTQKDTGRTMAEIFMENGIGIVRASSQRVQGWMVVKEFLKERPDGRPGMLFTEDCPRMIRDLPALQHDEKEPLGLRQRAPRDYPQSRRPALWADLPDDGGTAGAGAAGAGRCGLCGGVRRLHDRRRGRRRISELRRIRT